MAAAALDSGAAREKLELLARVSNRQGRDDTRFAYHDAVLC